MRSHKGSQRFGQNCQKIGKLPKGTLRENPLDTLPRVAQAQTEGDSKAR